MVEGTKAMKVGNAVTVVTRRSLPDKFELMPAHIVGFMRGKVRVRVVGFTSTIDYARVEEGVYWAQGHSGPAVDALRAAQALV